MKISSWIRSAFALALVVGLAGAAQAQDFSLSVSSGGIGTEVTVTANTENSVDFGSKKGKVVLSPAVDLKRRRSKPITILSWSNGSVTFVINKALAGLQDVTISQKGRKGESWTEANAFRVLGPQTAGIQDDEDQVYNGATIVVDGVHFGPNKGKVMLELQTGKKSGRKKPKITDWSNTTVTIAMPKKAAAGAYSLTLVNAAGEASLKGGVTLLGPPPKPISGSDRVTATIDGKKFNAQVGNAGDQAILSFGPLSTFSVVSQDTAIKNRRPQITSLQFNFEQQMFSGGPFPVELTGNQITAVLIGLPNGAGYSDDGNWRLTVDNVEDGRMSGSFSGTALLGEESQGKARISVKNGKFVLTLPE